MPDEPPSPAPVAAAPPPGRRADAPAAGSAPKAGDGAARAPDAAHAPSAADRLLELMSDAHAILDRDFRIVAVNRAAERAVGRARAELLGRSHWEAFPASVGTEVERQYRRVQAEGAEAHFTYHYVGDGYDFHLETDAYPTDEGGVAIFWRDVTARVRAEEALRASEARVREQARQLATVAENATLALFIMDERQRCTYMNPAAERLTGFTLGELQGQALHYYVHHTRPDGSPYPLEECPIDRAFPENMREQGTEVFVHKDGSFYEVEFTASPVREGDRTVGTIIEVRDVREERARERERDALLAAERAARAEAEAASRAKGEFLAVMSHELRTPLNAIGGYAELLDMEARGPLTPAQRADVGRIIRANRYLTALVNDVLNFARLEGGQVAVHPEAVEIGPVVADLEAIVTPQVAAKGLTFDHDACAPDTPDPPHRVRADPEKLRQVLLNLLTNAVKFTDRGGRVELRCENDRAAGVARIHVVDTGRGIAADQLARIFDPFVQVDRARTHESQQGLGLGLAISRDLARAMDGELTVESAPGAGSTFTLTLPAA